MFVVPYLYNINPSLQAPTRLPLGVITKFLTYDVQASLLFPLSCKTLETGHSHKWDIFSWGNNYLMGGGGIFRLVYLACQTVKQSLGLRSDWQGPWNGLCISLQHGVHSTSWESHSSNFFLLQESKALAISLTSHVLGLVIPQLGTL